MTTPLTPPLSLSNVQVRQAANGPMVRIFEGDIAWGYGAVLRSNDISSTQVPGAAQNYESDTPAVYLLNYDGSEMQTFIAEPVPTRHYRLSAVFPVQIAGTLAGDLVYSICVSRDGLAWVPYSTTVQQVGAVGETDEQWVWCRVETGWMLGSDLGVQAGDAFLRARIQVQASVS